MDFSATDIVLIIGALSALISSAIQQWRNGMRVKENTVITQATSDKADTLLQKTEVIHDLTNSNLASVKSDLAMALAQIKDLQALVARLTDPKRE